ncbi:MAG: hypothetical protein IPL59_17310 [Candidatus Competibacteraceae bacterium]|nr:hypothetical protein [Candidatus Competibacteraceae bacterium]
MNEELFWKPTRGAGRSWLLTATEVEPDRGGRQHDRRVMALRVEAMDERKVAQ